MLRFLIIQDHKENRAKCTVEPLRGSAGLQFVRLRKPKPQEERLPVRNGLLLTVDAPPLEKSDAEILGEDGVVVVLDGTWARLEPLQRRLVYSEPMLRRSLPQGFVTAYPRVSKLFEDPGAGLATVEAMYLVSAILGEPREDFLESYRWADDFRQVNREQLNRLGL